VLRASHAAGHSSQDARNYGGSRIQLHPTTLSVSGLERLSRTIGCTRQPINIPPSMWATVELGQRCQTNLSYNSKRNPIFCLKIDRAGTCPRCFFSGRTRAFKVLSLDNARAKTSRTRFELRALRITMRWGARLRSIVLFGTRVCQIHVLLCDSWKVALSPMHSWGHPRAACARWPRARAFTTHHTFVSGV
jgi:hypothetical protein